MPLIPCSGPLADRGDWAGALRNSRLITLDELDEVPHPVEDVPRETVGPAVAAGGSGSDSGAGRCSRPCNAAQAGYSCPCFDPELAGPVVEPAARTGPLTYARRETAEEVGRRKAAKAEAARLREIRRGSARARAGRGRFPVRRRR